MKKFRKNKKGFTLVEVVVVLVIIAILIAIAVPSVMKYIDDANEAKYLAEARAVYIATEAELTKDYADNKKIDYSIYTNQKSKDFLGAIATATGFDSETVISVKIDQEEIKGDVVASDAIKAIVPNEVEEYTFVFKSPSSKDYATVSIDKNGTAKLVGTSSTKPANI